MLECCWCVEKTTVDAVVRSVVIIYDRVPQLSGVFLRHLHNLICVAISDEVRLRESACGE